MGGDAFKVGGASPIHTVNHNCWSLKFMRERRTRWLTLGITAIAVGALSVLAQPASTADVKVTPLGLVAGKFCKFDRAMLFKDPSGTRIIYDAGRTVAGATDPHLGKIDYLLVSHMHGDHVGDKRQS